MRKNLYEGLYVVLEGIECSGKGTQIQLLKQSFNQLGLKEGVDYNCFAEPNPKCLFYDLIKSILAGKVTATSIFLQERMAANRDSFEINFLFDSLEKVSLTIVDRSFYSNFAYYMAGGGDYQDIMKLNANRIIPDCTIFLDISAEESMRRLKYREGKQIEIFEKKLEFIEALKKSYEKLFLVEEIGGKQVITGNGMCKKKVIASVISHIIMKKVEGKGILLFSRRRGE